MSAPTAARLATAAILGGTFPNRLIGVFAPLRLCVSLSRREWAAEAPRHSPSKFPKEPLAIHASGSPVCESLIDIAHGFSPILRTVEWWDSCDILRKQAAYLLPAKEWIGLIEVGILLGREKGR